MSTSRLLHGATDDAKAFQDFGDFIAKSPQHGGVLHVPVGQYRLGNTLILQGEILLEGEGGLGDGAGTRLLFKPKIDGIVVWNGTAQGMKMMRSGEDSVIRDISIEAVNDKGGREDRANPSFNEDDPLTSPGSGHGDLFGSGLVLYTRARIVNCRVANYYCDGIHIETRNSANHCNGFELQNCQISGNRRHGIYVVGTDSNVGRIVGVEIANNDGWAVYDDAQHGNTYVACRARDNGYFAADVRALALDPWASSRVWAGTADGGIYLTDNAGSDALSSWTAVNTGLGSEDLPGRNSVVNALAVDASDAVDRVHTVYAATAGAGVLRFSVLLSQWRRPGPELNLKPPVPAPTRNVRSLALAMANDPTKVPFELYAGGDVLGASVGGVWVTKAVGETSWATATWTPLTSDKGPLPKAPVVGLLAFHDLTQHTTLVLAALQGLGVYVTSNPGGGWSSYGNNGLTDAKVTCIGAADPSAIYVATESGGVFTSTDQGKSWTLLGTGGALPSAPVTAITVDPKLSPFLYASNGSGVYYYDDSSDAWASTDGVDSIGNPAVQCLLARGGQLYAGTKGLAPDSVVTQNPGGVYVGSFDPVSRAVWAPAAATYYGGAYKTEGGAPNAAGVFVGCQTSGFQASGNEVRTPTMVAGGAFGKISPGSDAGLIVPGGISHIPVRSPVVRTVRTFTASADKFFTPMDKSERVLLVDPTNAPTKMVMGKTVPGDAIVDLPDNSNGELTGYEFTIKRIGVGKGGAVILGSGGHRIDTDAHASLLTTQDCVTLILDGLTYRIVSVSGANPLIGP